MVGNSSGFPRRIGSVRLIIVVSSISMALVMINLRQFGFIGNPVQEFTTCQEEHPSDLTPQPMAQRLIDSIARHPRSLNYQIRGQIRSPMKRVISFALYGTDRRYLDGIEVNLRLASINYPGWTVRVYHDDTVPRRYIDNISRKYNELVEFVNISDQSPVVRSITGTMWRFLVADDPVVEYFIIRDVDSRLSRRDAAVVRHWILTRDPADSVNGSIIIVRDNVHHNKDFPILAGMWGGYRPGLQRVLNLTHVLLNHDERDQHHRTADQEFLLRYVWPHVQHQAAIYDSHQCQHNRGRRFPAVATGTEHVGQVVLANEMVTLPTDLNGNEYTPTMNGFAALNCQDPRPIHLMMDCPRLSDRSPPTSVKNDGVYQLPSWTIAQSITDNGSSIEIVMTPCLFMIGPQIFHSSGTPIAANIGEIRSLNAISAEYILNCSCIVDLSRSTKKDYHIMVPDLIGQIAQFYQSLPDYVPILIPSFPDQISHQLFRELLSLMKLDGDRLITSSDNVVHHVNIGYLVSGWTGSAISQARTTLFNAMKIPTAYPDELQQGRIIVFLSSGRSTLGHLPDYLRDYFIVRHISTIDHHLKTIGAVLCKASIVIITDRHVPLSILLFLRRGTQLKILDQSWDEVDHGTAVQTMGSALDVPYQYLPGNCSGKAALYSIITNALR